MTRLVIVNRFFPPDSAITGHAAHELAMALRKRLPQLEIDILACAARYRGGVTAQAREEEFSVRRVSSLSLLDSNAARFVASLADGYRLARAAAASADIVISMSDPPLLGYWMGKALARARRPVTWIEWTMDVYPEAFAASGLVSMRHPAYRHLATAVRRRLPDRYICLGTAQAEAIARWRGRRPTTILPCGVPERIPVPSAPPAWRQNETRRIIAYAGNLGAAHDAAALADLVARAPADRFAFVLSVYGSGAEWLSRKVGTPANVTWQKHLDHAELLHADVHAVSLREAWSHICVPSKAVSSICLGRPILFLGSAESDTWRMLGEGGWLVPSAPAGSSVLEGVLKEITDDTLFREKTRIAQGLGERLGEVRDRAFLEIGEVVEAAMQAGRTRNVSAATIGIVGDRLVSS